MTDDFQLSRRKALAALGTIGVASAGAGLGTSAYFSDQETFENNRLVAGELDLKMDWEEHYSDWSPDENTDRSEGDSDEGGNDDGSGTFGVQMERPQNVDQYRAFPPGTEGNDSTSDPLLWVPDEYVDDFMDNTSVEAFPDSDNDGIAEFPISEMGGQSPCEFLADVGDDDGGLVPDSAGLGRTDNEDTNADGSPAPLINLQDVKPGDFGEITFSTHLCDNPGYLWMNMPGGLTASEDDITEPEADDPDEDQNADGTLKDSADPDGKTVELVDKIQTALWYDGNCDNLITCEEKIDLMVLADTSDSIGGALNNGIPGEQADILRSAGNDFLTELDNRTVDGQIRIGFLTFNGPGDVDDVAAAFPRPALRAGLGPIDQFDTDSDGSPNLGDFLPEEGAGNTPMPHALDLAQKVLDDQGRSDATQVILLITDGLPDYNPPTDPDIPYEVFEGEGSPLPTTGVSYSSGTYASEGIGGTFEDEEKNETESVATTIQNNGTIIRAVGIGLPASVDVYDPDSGTTVDTITPNNYLRAGVAGTDGDPTNGQMEYFYDPDEYADLPTLASTIAQDIAGGDSPCDEVIFTGTLREAETALTGNGGRGLPLDANQATQFDEQSGTETDGNRECYSPFATHCFGFAWWLPENHGNEVQSDAIQFDLGFYTEQCRHNDGSGMNNDSVDA